MTHTTVKTNQRNNHDPASDYKIADKENWLNEHGHPSFEFLQSLAENGGPAALEKLRSIADDLDAEFNQGDSAQELIGSIRMSTGN